MPLKLQLPVVQNWSCHNCSGCCRQHLIEITGDERRRIEKMKWTAADGLSADQPLVVPFAGPPWRRRYRLAHQPDGACVFLDEQGLCRIHAKYGEDAKPLACRVYPYAFHPGGRNVAVSLRFSCPSVVANKGRPVTKSKQEIERLARAVVPESADPTPPPPVSSSQQLDWGGFYRIVSALDNLFGAPDVSICDKLRGALFWIDLIEKSQFERLDGDRLSEFLNLTTGAAEAEFAKPPEPQIPTRLGQMQFRLLVAQYARKDTVAHLSAGWRDRWRLLRAALRFARGRGEVPPLQDGFHPVPFESVERPCGPLPEGTDEIFTRYFRVKIQGLHFCGRAYFGVPLTEGFQSLALVFPAVIWIARWLAAGEKRDYLELDDIIKAVTVADHNHGYAEIFGTRTFRRRVRMLAQSGDLQKLCMRYGAG